MQRLAIGFALLLTIAAAAPARAVSVQEFNTTYSLDARGKGLLFSVEMEIYRNQSVNRPAQVACLIENFVPRRDKTTDFDIIIRALLDSTNPASESVESYIAGTMLKFCSVATAAKNTSSAATTDSEPISIKDFFSIVPNDTDKLQVARMALATQGLRAIGEGHRAYGQCILSSLYTLHADGTPPTGFVELYRQLGTYRNSDTSTEKFFFSAIKYFCGEEPTETAAAPSP